MPDEPKYTVFWSEEDQEFVGTVDAYPSLSWLAPTEQEALDGIQRLAQSVRDDTDGEDSLHDDDCAFCQGIRAFEAGNPEEDNPFPEPDTTVEEEVSDHFLWGIGYASADPSRFGTPYRRGERNTPSDGVGST